MRPHPRIRKTIKWGGAAVTVLLVGVWVGSGWWMFQWTSPNTLGVVVGQGWAVIGFDGHFECDPVVAHAIGHAAGQPFALQWTWLHWSNAPPNWAVLVPLWLPCAVFLLISAAFWRFDTVARRRERATRLNLCPKCGYDRTGLAGGAVRGGEGAVCPECGAKPDLGP